MTNLRIIRTAAVLAIGLPVAGFAVAQSDQQTTAVPKGAAAQPAVVQQAPVATVGPVSRPGKFGALGVQDSISVLLTADDCKNIGGTLDKSKTCASGQRCLTAGEDGVIRSKCIDKAT